MKRKGNVGLAVVLIAVGVWFLLIELVPSVKAFAYNQDFWPIPIIAIGGLLALVALATWTPPLLVPAAIVGGIGGLLYYQNLTGDWASWAYAWALIPCFVGLGILLAGLLERNLNTMAGGAWTLFSGLMMFAIFGAFLGGSWAVFRFWPALLILAGFAFIARGLVKRRPA